VHLLQKAGGTPQLQHGGGGADDLRLHAVVPLGGAIVDESPSAGETCNPSKKRQQKTEEDTNAMRKSTKAHGEGAPQAQTPNAQMEDVRVNALLDYMFADDLMGDPGAVGRKWGVPEDTIRAWIAAEMNREEGETGALAKTYEQDIREIRYRAAAGLKHTVAIMQQHAASKELKDADAERYATVLAKLAEKPEEEMEAEQLEGGVVQIAQMMPEDAQNGSDTG
jgi:hypothetical protein